jgi:hypothetical protein
MRGGTGSIFLRNVTYSSGSQSASITANEWEEWGKKYKFLLFQDVGYWQSMYYAPPLCDWGKAKMDGTSSTGDTYYLDHSNASVYFNTSNRTFAFSVGSSKSNFKIYGIPF